MNPSQIAEETEKALEYYHDKKQRVFIIQAAIEKALESPKNVAALKAIYDKGVLHGRADQSRAAHTSEPNQIVTQLRHALESAGLLDCDGPDATEEADRIIKSAAEKFRNSDLECITTRTRERDAYKLRCEELESRAARASEEGETK